MLSLWSAAADSSILSEAHRKLIGQDTLGAIDLLLDWSEAHEASAAVVGLLDRIQLPDGAQAIPLPPPAAPTPRPWSIRAEGLFRADDDLPAQGGVTVQRRITLADSGRRELFLGTTAGSWMEDASPYASVDAWAGLGLRRFAGSAFGIVWAGWTEENHPELGASLQWRWTSRCGALRLSQGPSVRYSWRRTRFAGWSADLGVPVAGGSLQIGGAAWLRQDPSWALDTGAQGWHLSRWRLQSTFDATFLHSSGRWAFGPGVDLDARSSLSRDHWTDSADSLHHALRQDLAASAKAVVRWSPGHTAIQAEVGWTWTAASGEAYPALSPFAEGFVARLKYQSEF